MKLKTVKSKHLRQKLYGMRVNLKKAVSNNDGRKADELRRKISAIRKQVMPS